MKKLVKIISLLDYRSRVQGAVLCGVVTFVASLEVAGVASIFPFLAVLGNPSLLDSNDTLRAVYAFSQNLGLQNETSFILFLGLFIFSFYLLSLVSRGLSSYAQWRFIQKCEYMISKRLIVNYFNQPYTWSLHRNSSDIGRVILSEVGYVVTHALIPLVTICSQGLVACFLISLLFYLNASVALTIGLVIVAAYVMVFFSVRNFLSDMGQRRQRANDERFKSVSEGFGAFKEIKMGGYESVFVERFMRSAQAYARVHANLELVGQIPRLVLEAIVFGGMLLLTLHTIYTTGDFSSAAPVLGLYALAGYRLMPVLQQIYGSLALLRVVDPALNKIYADSFENTECAVLVGSKNLFLDKFITLENVTFKYPSSNKTAIENITFEIPAGSKVGIVGVSGSGKTTLIDIILGLHEPQQGFLRIDDEVITKEQMLSWQKLIGYVPQQIYLTDDTIAANIAFGLNRDEINYDAVVRAAVRANIHQFIIEELPHKYDTKVGERGVRLSGGQRQRIGIARALYNDPKVLVLDEATSALDSTTERSVMNAIQALKGEVTIILVAHRLTTLAGCDQILALEKGKIISKGSYADLILSDDKFKTISGNKL